MIGKETRERVLTGRLSVFIIMLFLCFMWGSAYPIVKIGYDVLSVDKTHTPSIMLFAGIRYVITGLMLLIPGIIRSPKSFAIDSSTRSTGSFTYTVRNSPGVSLGIRAVCGGAGFHCGVPCRSRVSH